MEKQALATYGPRWKGELGPIPAGDLTACAQEYFSYLAEHTAEGFCIDECPLCGILLASRDLLLDHMKPTELAPKPAGWRGALAA